MASKSILIIDDDEVVIQTLKEQLELQGEFVCHGCTDAASGQVVLKDQHVDLLLLDAVLPDMDGRVLCRQLRQEYVNLPIIMLMSAEGEPDVEDELHTGANDYVTKPFRFAALLARVRSQLRSYEQSEDSVLRLGPYAFRPGAKTLLDESGALIRLTEKEANILKYLFRRGTEIVGREVLLAEVWGYNSGVTTHTLETHIYRLRQKIERDPSNASILITEAGGYRLVP
tara:strand:- start:24099 stop:24782 length:684 start_codon:yes stop_codon:yes gene_type:complete